MQLQIESLNSDVEHVEQIANSDPACVGFSRSREWALVSTSVVSAIGNGAAFKKGRESWLGLVPRQWAPAVAGVGLAGMRERVRELGGSLELRSGRGGTTVVIRIPAERASIDSEQAGESGRGVSAT